MPTAPTTAPPPGEERPAPHHTALTPGVAAAHCILPPRIPFKKPPAPRRVASTVHAAPIRLPRGCKRIIVFANAALPFAPETYLRPGDLCIHLNRAKQATPAVLNTKDTTHWLLVRHSASEPIWFSPENLNPFETVRFIGGTGYTSFYRSCPWYQKFSGISSKSPTTGFIAACCMRDLFPNTPLLLVGFDPGHYHGTSRWTGHDWPVEEAWYRDNHFLPLPPVQYFHQIWIGGNMPEEERRWTGHIRAAASKAGWRYRLWTERELFREFAAEPATRLLADALKLAPHAVTYSFATDYFRYRVLAAYPGIYADTDFELRHEEFPALPQETILSMNCTAFFFTRSTLPFSLAAALAEKKIIELLSDPTTRLFSPRKCAEFLTKKNLARDGVDGWFLEREVEPVWKKAGISMEKMPFEFCAGRGGWWGRTPIEKTTFWHWGTWHWHDVPEEFKANLRARAELPRPLRLHILISSAAKYAERRAAIRDTWLAHLPPGVTYQFYYGGDTPPGEDEPDVLWLKGVDDTYAGLPAKEIASLRAVAQDPGWDWVGQVDDDTYLHVPRLLAHLLRLMPGAHLVGRSRNGERCPGGAGYFLTHRAVKTILNYASEIPDKGRDDELITRCAVQHGIPITDLPMLHQGAGETVPTPENDTVSGHPLKDPAAMRRVYAAFPATPIRIHIAIRSFNEPDPLNEKRFKRSGSGSERRAAMRATWLADLPPGVTYSFICGTPTDPALLPTDEPDTTVHPSPDTIKEEIHRLAAALRHAVSLGVDFILSCDDDIYCHIPRLVEFCRTLTQKPGLYGIDNSRTSPGNVCGGAILLARPTAEALLAHPAVGGPKPETGKASDDVLCAAARALSIPIHPVAEFSTLPTVPTPENSVILCHWCPAERMAGIHAPFAPSLFLCVCSAGRFADRREGCRDTWLAHLPPWVSYTFIMGGDTPPGEEETDVLWMPGMNDAYDHITPKLLAAYRHMLSIPGWEWMGKVDDDTYLHVRRLLHHLQRNPRATHIGRSRNGGARCPGGAGYFLRRAALQTIIDHAREITATDNEDGQFTNTAVRHGHRITDLPALHQFPCEGVPEPGNDTVSGHDFKDPADMRRIHSAFAPTIHQIWLGSPLPPREAAWVRSLRLCARRAGIMHRLWTEEELLREFADDPATPLLRRLLELCPTPAIYGVVSDYFKLRLLAHDTSPAGALYFDTDVYPASPDGAFPQLPTEADAYFMRAREHEPDRLNICAIHRPAGRSTALFARVAELSRDRLFSFFPEPEACTAESIAAALHTCSVLKIIGPFFQREHVFPTLAAEGYRLAPFSTDFIAFPDWQPPAPAPLIHQGTLTWDQKAAQYFHQIWIGGNMPEEERRWTGHIREAASKAGWQYRLWTEQELLEEFADEPATRLLADAFNFAPHTLTYSLACDYFRYRVLAAYPGVYADTDFELTTPEFPAFPPDELSYNSAAFYLSRAARPFQIATELAEKKLFAILADPDTRAFSPQKCARFFNEKQVNTDGMDGPFLHSDIEPAWKAAGISPAKMPLELCAGNASWWHFRKKDQTAFYHCGTGHWAFDENTAFKADILRRAALPRFPRLHIAVQSYNQPDPRHRGKLRCGPGSARRAAMRETWLAHLPPGVTFSFICGTPTDPALLPTDEPDTIVHPAPDALLHMLPRRVAHLRHALDLGADYVLSCDDDLYCHIPRLLEFIRALPPAPTLYGLEHHPPVNNPTAYRELHPLCGGAILFSRFVAEKLLALPAVGGPTHTLTDDEDIDLCRAAASISLPRVAFPNSLTSEGTFPTPENDIIFGHHVDPARMRALHAALTP